ncbi:MAG: hypothetical protein CMH57_07450 [Myxococcales bacterium]|nr:hypothetical protein [Myxococcales bacterium]
MTLNPHNSTSRALLIALLFVLVACGSDRSQREAPTPDSDAPAPPATTAPEPDPGAERYIALASALGCAALEKEAEGLTAERRRLLSEHQMDDEAWLELSNRYARDPDAQARLTQRLAACAP